MLQTRNDIVNGNHFICSRRVHFNNVMANESFNNNSKYEYDIIIPNAIFVRFSFRKVSTAARAKVFCLHRGGGSNIVQ